MKKHIILFIIGLVIIFSKANAGLKYGPYLSQVTKTSVAITWITDNDSGNNKVLWGTGTPVNEVLQSSSDYNNLHNLWNHVVYISGLSANTYYNYQVSSDGQNSPVYDFKTAVNFGDSFSFGITCDTHGDSDDLGIQLEHCLQNGAEFFISGGDLMQDSERLTDDLGWDDIFSSANAYPNSYGVSKNFMASHAFYNTISSHDAGWPPPLLGLDPYVFFFTFPDNGIPWSSSLYKSANYRKEFNYAFAYGNVYFICLASEKDVSGITPREQVDWLEQQLQIGQNYAFRIAYSHRGGYNGTDMAETAEAWTPLFEKYNLNFHFHGHSHHWETTHINNVDYHQISAGRDGIWGEVHVTSTSMNLNVFNNGTIIDSFNYAASIVGPTPIPCNDPQ